MAVTTIRGVKKAAAAGSSFLELLPRDVILEVAKHVHESEALAFVLTCKGCRDAMKESLRGRNNTEFTGKRRKLILTTTRRRRGRGTIGRARVFP
jgi:hypothetical protein